MNKDRKIVTAVSIDPVLKSEAKEMGFNLSLLLENAIRNKLINFLNLSKEDEIAFLIDDMRDMSMLIEREGRRVQKLLDESGKKEINKEGD